MIEPKRPYEMIMKIGADTLDDLARSLSNIEYDIVCMIERGHSNPHITTSGSPSTGYSFSLVRTETADHDEYFKQIEQYLADKKENKPK